MAHDDASAWRVLPSSVDRPPKLDRQNRQPQGGASSAPPSFDDRGPNPPLKNRMLYLVDMRDKLAEAKARHAGQAASTTQPEAVPANAGEPKAKSLGRRLSPSSARSATSSRSSRDALPALHGGTHDVDSAPRGLHRDGLRPDRG